MGRPAVSFPAPTTGRCGAGRGTVTDAPLDGLADHDGEVLAVASGRPRDQDMCGLYGSVRPKVDGQVGRASERERVVVTQSLAQAVQRVLTERAPWPSCPGLPGRWRS